MGAAIGLCVAGWPRPSSCLSRDQRPQHFLFFSPTATSQAAADAFLARLDERTEVRDAPVSNETIGAQITALAKWEQGTSPVGLTNVDKPVLIVNGDDDTTPAPARRSSRCRSGRPSR